MNFSKIPSFLTTSLPLPYFSLSSFLTYSNSLLILLSSFSLPYSCFHSATGVSFLTWQFNYLTVQGLKLRTQIITSLALPQHSLIYPTPPPVSPAPELSQHALAVSSLGFETRFHSWILCPESFIFLMNDSLLSLRICPNMSSLKTYWNHQEVMSLSLLLEKFEHLVSPHSTLGVSFVIVAFWGREIKTKWILVIFFQIKSMWGSLLMTFLFIWCGED